jgi:hypothetical protein
MVVLPVLESPTKCSPPPSALQRASIGPANAADRPRANSGLPTARAATSVRQPSSVPPCPCSSCPRSPDWKITLALSGPITHQAGRTRRRTSPLAAHSEPSFSAPALAGSAPGETPVRVDFQPHGEQFAAQVGAVAQQFHRHGPISPAARRVLEAQQPPEVVAGAVEGLRFNVQRPAHPGIHRHRLIFLGCAHGVKPDARPQLAPGVGHRPSVIDAKAGALFLGNRLDGSCCASPSPGSTALASRSASAGTSGTPGFRLGFRQNPAVAGLYPRNPWNP